MTTQELHIQLDILLQKISSNWNKNFLPQEKDYFLNSEIRKYIRQRVNPRSNAKQLSIFDVVQRVQNLNSLVRTVPLNVTNYNQREVVIQLPFNFLSYIGTEVITYPLCVDEVVPVTNVVSYINTLTPIQTITGLTEAVISVTLGGVTTELFRLSTLPTNYLPQDTITDYLKAFIYNNAIAIIGKRNLPVGLEVRFNNSTQKFEFRSNAPFSMTFDVTVNGNITPQVVGSYNVTGITNNVVGKLYSEVGIIDEEFKPAIVKSNLSGVKDEHAIGYLREHEVFLIKNKSVVYSGANLTYICKPVQIDVLLNCNSDLPDEVLEEVVSNTAQYMKGVISSDTYEKFARENTLIE